jgi:NUMOD3 motif
MTKSTKTNHYTYIIRHINGRYYIGRHSTKKDPLLDPYMGSGNWVKSIKDRSTLTKTIIAQYPNVDELKIAEFELIEKYFLDVYCMNVLYSSSSSGDTGNYKRGEEHYMYGKTISEQTKKIISDALSGDKNPMYGRTGENNPNFGKSGILSPNYGKKLSEETKQLMSEAKIGENNPMYGKTGELCPSFGLRHTDETKKLISNAHSGEKSYKATINDYIARMIKIRISEGVKNKIIAEEFNTTVAVVKHIRYGRTWKHILRLI